MSIVMKLCLVISTFLFNSIFCNDFHIGKFDRENDVIVLKHVLHTEKNHFDYATAKYETDLHCPIIYVKVANRIDEGVTPNVRVTDGGLYKKHIALLLTSSYNAPISAAIYIACELRESSKTARGHRYLQCGEQLNDKSTSQYEWSHAAGGWFKYHPTPATWVDARYTCHAEGATLVSPLSKQLSSAVKSFVQKRSSPGYHGVTIFIGVHATYAEGCYSSIEGVPLEKLEITWAPGEPDNHHNSERCLAMRVHGDFETVADTHCDRKLPYLCYKPKTEISYIAELQCPAEEKYFKSDYEWSEKAGAWLKYHLIPSIWDRAMSRCEAEGAVLASPLTRQLKAAIENIVQRRGVFHQKETTIFTGVRQNSSKIYTSIDGKSLHEMPISWLPRESEDTDPESCIAMAVGNTGAIKDMRCDAPLPYVCYKQHAPLTVSECGTDPEYLLRPETGSCYKLHKKGMNWSDAYMTCEAEEGHLVIINNKVEKDVVEDILTKATRDDISNSRCPSFVSIGFIKWCEYGNYFRTIHGETLDVSLKWETGEPNNGKFSGSDGSSEDCGTVYWATMGLNDHWCHCTTPFLCEKMPNSCFT